MQVAHPSVAAAVAQHSDFLEDPFRRLWRTLDAMIAISFGDSEQSRRAAQEVGAIHRRVRGSTGKGEPYRATDPALLKWVHATLVDSGLVAYRRFFGRLTDREATEYVVEMNRLAVLMGVPEKRLEQDAASFSTYVRQVLRAMTVSEDARWLAPWIVRPPAPLALRPLTRFQELVTVGLLPESLREGYGLRWTPAQERLLRASEALARTVVPRLPGVLRRWPQARAADRRAAGTRSEGHVGLQRRA
jgi:uncharacterized protein (DUF2236 family)